MRLPLDIQSHLTYARVGLKSSGEELMKLNGSWMVRHKKIAPSQAAGRLILLALSDGVGQRWSQLGRVFIELSSISLLAKV